MADKYGRKLPEIIGWVAGIIAPLMVIFARNWATVVSANVFLGICQGIC